MISALPVRPASGRPGRQPSGCPAASARRTPPARTGQTPPPEKPDAEKSSDLPPRCLLDQDPANRACIRRQAVGRKSEALFPRLGHGRAAITHHGVAQQHGMARPGLVARYLQRLRRLAQNRGLPGQRFLLPRKIHARETQSADRTHRLAAAHAVLRFHLQLRPTHRRETDVFLVHCTLTRRPASKRLKPSFLSPSSSMCRLSSNTVLY